jgi:hypothetical protein
MAGWCAMRLSSRPLHCWRIYESAGVPMRTIAW